MFCPQIAESEEFARMKMEAEGGVDGRKPSVLSGMRRVFQAFPPIQPKADRFIEMTG